MIASNRYSCPIWVLILGKYLTYYFCVAYLHAGIPRDILVSDNLECFSTSNTLLLGPLSPLTITWQRRPSSLYSDVSHMYLYLGRQRSWRYSIVYPVSGSKTGIAIWSSDVSVMHQSASNSLGELSWAACVGVTLRACLSYDIILWAMGCSDGWDWERVRRPTGSWISSLLGVTLGEGACTWS